MADITRAALGFIIAHLGQLDGPPVKIKLATLNVWGLPAPLANDTPERIGAIADRLAALDANIVTLQEAWTSDVKQPLTRGKTYPARWYRKENFGGGGLLVLSRHPILQARFVNYALRGLPQRIHQGDYFAHKGFLHLQLAMKRGPVSVINTHLQAPYTSDGASEYAGIQAGQLVQLAAYLTTVSDPLLVAGDFNIEEGSRHYNAFRGLTHLEDVAVSLDQRLTTVQRANPYRAEKLSPDGRPDYIFCRPGATRRVSPLSIRRVFDDSWKLEGRRLSFSNHYGLLAEFDIQEATQSPLPGPRQDAVETARGLLEEGKRLAQNRRNDERMIAGASVALGSLYFSPSLRRRISRRRFLKVSFAALPVFAYPSAAGLLTLSEVYARRELQAYHEMLQLLDSLDKRATAT